MLKSKINISVLKSDGSEFFVTKIIAVEWKEYIKDFGNICKITIPNKKIVFDGLSINFGDLKVEINDTITINIYYDGVSGYDEDGTANSKATFTGYVTRFQLNKTEITIEIEDAAYLLKKMPRVKMSKQKATMKDILETICPNISLTDTSGDISVDGIGKSTIFFNNYEFNGNFKIDDALTPYEILKNLKDDLQIDIYVYSNKIYIGRETETDTAYKYAYPYISGYNFVIDVNIDQYTNDLSTYVVKGTSVVNSTTKFKYAYDVDGEASYAVVKDNTINLKYPSVTEATLKTLVETAWSKLSTEKQKSGSFLTFAVPYPKLNDLIKLNIYGEDSVYTIDGVSINFSVNDSSKLDILLGKKQD